MSLTARSRAWRWPDGGQIILALALAGMDAALIYLPTRLFQPALLQITGGPYTISPPLLIALEFTGWLLSRSLILSGRRPESVRVISGVLGLALALLAYFISYPNSLTPVKGNIIIGPVVAGALLAALAWARGMALSALSLDFNTAYTGFRLGAAMFVIGGMLLAFGLSQNDPGMTMELGPLALLFFACGLFALAASNLLSRSSDARTQDRPARLDARWTTILGGVVLLVLLIGALGVAAGIENLAGTLQAIALWIIGLVGYLLYWVIYIIFWLLYTLILNPLAELIRGLTRQPQDTPPQPPMPTPEPLPTGSADTFHIPAGFDVPLQWVATVLIVLGVILLLTRLLRSYRANVQIDADYERESLGGWDLFLAQLKAWLNRLFRRVRPATTAATDSSARLEDRTGSAEVLSIRRIYAALQKEAAAAGYPRRAAQTPDEYLKALQTGFPAAAADLAALTRAYAAARYGPPPLPQPLVAEANTLWQRIRPLLVVVGTGDQ